MTRVEVQEVCRELHCLGKPYADRVLISDSNFKYWATLSALTLHIEIKPGKTECRFHNSSI